MGTSSTTLEQSIEKAINDLESVADQIRVKLHLANMDAVKAFEAFALSL